MIIETEKTETVPPKIDLCIVGEHPRLNENRRGEIPMNQSSLSRFPDSGELRSSIDRNRDLALILALGGILVAILVPLPGAVMDALLGVNIAVSVLILLTVVYLKGPLEFAAFPSMLLIATLYRLALNIATTRLVLSKAQDEGSMAAGKVVNFFGEFVSGSNAVVGFIIFSVLVVIQFLVVTKGASRIAEVAARFSLDRMPGAQMSIDADLTAGNISASEARLAREDLALKADGFCFLRSGRSEAKLRGTDPITPPDPGLGPGEAPEANAGWSVSETAPRGPPRPVRAFCVFVLFVI